MAKSGGNWQAALYQMKYLSHQWAQLSQSLGHSLIYMRIYEQNVAATLGENTNKNKQ